MASDDLEYSAQNIQVWNDMWLSFNSCFVPQFEWLIGPVVEFENLSLLEILELFVKSTNQMFSFLLACVDMLLFSVSLTLFAYVDANSLNAKLHNSGSSRCAAR